MKVTVASLTLNSIRPKKKEYICPFSSPSVGSMCSQIKRVL